MLTEEKPRCAVPTIVHDFCTKMLCICVGIRAVKSTKTCKQYRPGYYSLAIIVILSLPLRQACLRSSGECHIANIFLIFGLCVRNLFAVCNTDKISSLIGRWVKSETECNRLRTNTLCFGKPIHTVTPLSSVIYAVVKPHELQSSTCRTRYILPLYKTLSGSICPPCTTCPI